jgi:hypothetical protein
VARATIGELLEILSRLKSAKIDYHLSDHTDDAIMVEVAVPGERWEIELHEDGKIGVERFVSSGGVRGPEELQELFDRFSD